MAILGHGCLVRVALLLAIFIVLLTAPGGGFAAEADLDAAAADQGLPIAASLAEGEAVLPPLAYVTFCQKFAEDCVPTPQDAPLPLTRATWRALTLVNTIVNDTIHATTEPAGQDIWERGVHEGDCEEYALEKRYQLFKAGYPLGALSLSEVEDRAGAPHLVLTVRTDHGAFVLDNMHSAVLPWDRTGYRFIKVQSLTDPMRWVSIQTPAARGRTAPSN